MCAYVRTRKMSTTDVFHGWQTCDTRTESGTWNEFASRLNELDALPAYEHETSVQVSSSKEMFTRRRCGVGTTDQKAKLFVPLL